MTNDCKTCEYFSHQGEGGTLPTCDAPTALDDTHDADEVDATVSAFMQGHAQHCPHHSTAWWAEPGEAEAFVAWARGREERR